MSALEYSSDFTIQDLVDIKVHFGQRESLLNPKMRDYVFGTKNGISIIDVRKTYTATQNALNLCYKFGKMGKKILFVGTAPQISNIVKECAEKCGQFYVTDRWLGGILTNWYTVSKSIKTLISYNKMLEDKENGLSKKEVMTVTKERDKLMSSFGGLMNLRGRPDLVIVFNTIIDYLAVKEALAIGIPTIALMDTNASISGITYPIASNDDSASVIKFFCDEFSKAILAGVQANMKSSGVDMSVLLKKNKEQKKEDDTVSEKGSTEQQDKNDINNQ